MHTGSEDIKLYHIFGKAMYSKEEAKALREEFWDSFNTMSAHRRIRKKLPGNWNTSARTENQ